jgi:hypothetical protein
MACDCLAIKTLKTLASTPLIIIENSTHMENPKMSRKPKSFIEAGFEYVTEFEGSKIFRKRKL